MNDIEQKITAALRAEAALVTEDSLRPPGNVGVLVVGGDGGEPQPMPPAQTTVTPNPPTASGIPPSTVTSSGQPTSVPSATPPPQCGGRPCQVVQSVRIGTDTLEVLAAESADEPGNLVGRLVRVRGGSVLPEAPTTFDNFVTRDSLRCATVAGRDVCLLGT